MAIKAVISGGAGISASVTTKQIVMSSDLQTVWDAETDPNKNTFVDANDTEILTFVDWNWTNLIASLGLGYNYPPPTGQITSYRTGDDADIESTIFGSTVRDSQTLKARNTLASFSLLNNNNIFGNKNKLTDIDGLQIYGDGLVIDHYTGLMWYNILSTATWDVSIDNALASTQGGYSDWFMANVVQTDTLVNRELTDIIPYAPFSITGTHIRTSTTPATATANAFYYFKASSGVVLTSTKTSGLNYLLCRKHY